MSDKVTKLSVLNIVLIGVIIALGCVAVMVIVRIYGTDAPANPTTPAPASPPVAVEPPAESPAEAVRQAEENPPERPRSIRENLADHLMADFAGRQLWQRRVGKLEGRPIAVTDDGVYITTSAGMLFALDNQGEVRWSKALDENMFYGPVLDESGNVFCSTWSKAWSFDPAGNRNWEFTFPGKLLTGPVVDSRGNLIIKAEDRKADTGFILSVNSRGEERWRYDAEYELTTTHLAAMPNGRICDLGKTGTFQTLTPAGTRGWGLGLGDYAMGPAVDGRGMVYVAANPYDEGAATYYLVCMEPKGGWEIWSVELPCRASWGPWVNDASTVYILCRSFQGSYSEPHSVMAFDKSGAQLWDTTVNGALTLVCSPRNDDPLGVLTAYGTFFLNGKGEIIFSLSEDAEHPEPIAIYGNTAYCYADEVVTALDITPPD